MHPSHLLVLVVDLHLVVESAEGLAYFSYDLRSPEADDI